MLEVCANVKYTISINKCIAYVPYIKYGLTSKLRSHNEDMEIMQKIVYNEI